jgi:hypothetical protein
MAEKISNLILENAKEVFDMAVHNTEYHISKTEHNSLFFETHIFYPNIIKLFIQEFLLQYCGHIHDITQQFDKENTDYNLFFENGDPYLTLVEDCKEIKEWLDNFLKDFTGRIIKDNIPYNRIPVFTFYSQFEKQFDILNDNGYICENGEYLKWEKSKQSLAEYFGYMPVKNNNHQWKFIEKLFNETGLKNSFSTNGSSYGGSHSKKKSRDYEKLLEILKNTPEGK